MTRYLDPDRILDDWLAAGPTELSDHAVNDTISRLAAIPQRRPSRLRRLPAFELPRRALFAAAGLAAAIVIAFVTWAALTGRLAPPNVPPAATPAGHILICHWGVPQLVVAEIERARAELGVDIAGPDDVSGGGDLRGRMGAYVLRGCDLIVAQSGFNSQAGLHDAVYDNPNQRFALIDHIYYPGDIPNLLRINVAPAEAGRAVYDAIRSVINGTFRGATLTGADEPPATTPAAETPGVCHWDVTTEAFLAVESASTEFGMDVEGPDYVSTGGDLRVGVREFVAAGCDLIIVHDEQQTAAEAFSSQPDQLGVVMGSTLYAGRHLPNVLWIDVTGPEADAAIHDAIRQLAEGTFRGGTLTAAGLAPPAAPSTSSRPPADGPFSPTGLLAQPNGRGGSVLLPDGRVLVLNRAIPMGTAPTEVVHPLSGAVETTGQPNKRFESTVTLLRDGRVLLIGGVRGRPDVPPLATIASAEIWDPATERFTPAGSMAQARRNHTATLLADGRVLVVGGEDTNGFYDRPLSRAEVWDPATGGFSPTGPLADARYGHTATLLADGRVLIVGGSLTPPPGSPQEPANVSSAEVWDPTTHQFSPAGAILDGRVGSATLLPDGRVLIASGTSAEIWDSATNSFSPIGSESPAPTGAVAVLVHDGRVLFFGGGSIYGSGSVTVEQWDPATGVFSTAPPLIVPISPLTATVLNDGRVLVFGLANFSDMTAVVYDPGADQ